MGEVLAVFWGRVGLSMASGLGHLGFRCTGCGNCCRELRVPLTSADLRRLTAGSGLPAECLVDWLDPEAVNMTGEPESFVRLSERGRVLMALAQREGACRLLDEANRCTAYMARPANCRLFPFAPEFGRRGGLRRLRLLGGTQCDSGTGEKHDPHALRVADRLRWDEHRAYLVEVEAWNRSQRHRERLRHPLLGAGEFLHFLGVAQAREPHALT